MKRSIHLSESSEAYIAARTRTPVISAEINGALAMLQHLARENLPKLSEAEWAEIVAVYRDKDFVAAEYCGRHPCTLWRHYSLAIAPTNTGTSGKVRCFFTGTAIRHFGCNKDIPDARNP